jgi:phosphate transport system substrate-binding protein
MLLAVLPASVIPGADGTLLGAAGRILIAGNGPELRTIQDLGAAFERANPGAVVEIEWQRNVKAVEMVKEGSADVAIAGQADPELDATPIAWDGIAIVVNFSNPITQLTSAQVRSVLTGEVRFWSEFGGPETRIELIHRPPDRNIRAGLEQSLGISGVSSAPGKSTRSDQRVLSNVAGDLSAIAYVSLGQALDAFHYGMPVRPLLIDGVEAAEPTVKSGQYKLRRPILLLFEKAPNPTRSAFIDFSLSSQGQRIIDENYIPNK